MKKKRVCIIIVVYLIKRDQHQSSELEACLTSIEKVLEPQDQVYLWANDSPDRPIQQEVANRFSQFHWEFGDKNIGFTGGNHKGIQWALSQKFETIFLLNPDTEISKKTIPRLVEVSKELQDQCILGPLLLRSMSNDPIIDSAGLKLDKFYRAIDTDQGKRLSETELSQGDPVLPVEGLCGAAMWIPAKLFPLRRESEFSIFLEEFFVYFEDMEFSLYWTNKGHRFYLVLDAPVLHHRGCGSRLKKVTLQRWKNQSLLIERMILNRYYTIALHVKSHEFYRNLPRFLFYESARWIYIAIKKPYLLSLLRKSVLIITKRFFSIPRLRARFKIV